MTERLTYQVEYMSRPDERDHVVPCPTYRQACALARRMSDEHDGTAYVVAMDDVETEGGPCFQAVGHVSYVFGVRNELEGRVV